MVKKSTVAAVVVGALVVVAGVAAAVLCPLAGTVAGAYFVFGAAKAAGLATAAVCALSVAGAIGGLAVGVVAAKIVMLGSVALAGIAGISTKGLASLAGGLFGPFKRKEKSASPAVAARNNVAAESKLASASVKPGFDAAVAQGVNDNSVATPASVNAPKLA